MNFDNTTENVLKELEKTQHDFWNIGRATAMFLYTMIKNAKTKSAIEIGTSNGYSGIWLGKALKQTGGHLTTIEFYEKRQSLAKENFKTCQVDDVIACKIGSAYDVLQDIDFDIDFAFIDANKKEYIKYFEELDKHLVKGGIITADNILSHKEKCQPFVDKISNDSRYSVEILDLPAGLLVAVKNEV